MNFNKIYLLPVLLLLFLSCDDSGLGDLKPRYPVQQKRSEKRGFSFNSISQTDILLMSEGCTWSYNWGASTNNTLGSLFDDLYMDFCPMGWRGVNSDIVRNYVAAHPGTKYLLGTNEPNLTDQANQTPAQTAETWQQYVDLSKELNLKLVSPALNYGTLPGYQDPVKWLDEFFTLVNPDDIHAIAIHCYMPNAASMKGFIDKFRKYGKPIWLTEFCTWENATLANQSALMIDLVNYMEADPLVERYAWFMLRGGPEDVHNALADKSSPPQLTELGLLYNALSSQDKSTYYLENQTIEAEKYSNINSFESVGEDGLKAAPSIRFTTDPEGGNIDVTNMKPDMWLEYQIDVPATGTYDFQLRYSTAIEGEMNLQIDGTSQSTFSLPRSTDPATTWVTLTDNLKLNKGKHTLRLTLTEGSLAFNWLKFKIP